MVICYYVENERVLKLNKQDSKTLLWNKFVFCNIRLYIQDIKNINASYYELGDKQSRAFTITFENIWIIYNSSTYLNNSRQTNFWW